jgi:hypothetical protein
MLLVAFSNAMATELRVTPLISGEEDIAKVAMRPDGGVGILRTAGVDFVRADGTRLSIARTEEGEIPYLADGGEFVGIARYRPGAADFTPTASFELHDARGRVIWKTGETEDVTYAISRNGAVVGMSLNINVPGRNALHFYDRAGAIVASAEVPYLESGRFDPSGEIFFGVSARDGLRAFDSAGRALWSVPDCRLFAATEGARDVAVIGQGNLRLVRNGTLAAAISLGDLLVRRVSIAPDGSRIAIAGKHEIRVYAGTSLTILWSTRTGDDALSWTSLDVAAADGWLMAGVARDLGPSVEVDRRHPDGEVRAYDAAGSLVHRAGLTFPIWNIWSPTVVIDRSGKAATITTRRAVYRTVLP